MDYIHVLTNEKNAIASLIAKCKVILKDSPEGKIILRNSKSRIQLSFVKDSDPSRHEIYISKKDETRYKKCLQTFYCRKLLPLLQKEYDDIDSFIKSNNSQNKYEVLISLPQPIRELIDPIAESHDDIYRKWTHAVYNKNPYPFEPSRLYLTKKGDYVRSKSELIIASILDDMNLAYKYECEYKINGYSVYPDFTIMHPDTLEIYFLELFGMMDDQSYASKTLKKIQQYSKTKDADHFIYIFESLDNPLDLSSVKNLLNCYFGDCVISH